MGTPIVRSEFLCFVQNKYIKVSRTELTTSLVEFYNVDELVNSKKMLYEFDEKPGVEHLPTFTERIGNNKLRANIDDVLASYAFLDVNKIKLLQYATFCVCRQLASHQVFLQPCSVCVRTAGPGRHTNQTVGKRQKR